VIGNEQPDVLRSLWQAFEPARRASAAEIEEAVQSLSAHAVVGGMLDAANVAMVVVNRELQIVATNRLARDLVGAADASALVGRRFGEVFGCSNSNKCADGCGGAEPCAECGITITVLDSLAHGEAREAQCVLSAPAGPGPEAVELHVRATPVQVGEATFTAVALRDISDSKRREVLERVFVHDLRNTLTALIGWSETLTEDPGEPQPEAAHKIVMLARRLAREVEDYRLLAAVEEDRFAPSIRTVAPAAVLAELADAFTYHEVARDKQLVLAEPIADAPLDTDPTVLGRILTNLIVNAFEATAPGGRVELGCRAVGDALRFSVWNAEAIPEPVAARIFERSFSTKEAAGRGLGTYSTRLFGERCLGGKVWFTTSAAEGTTFFVELPRAATS
jgi:signal transduction histidine kinase